MRPEQIANNLLIEYLKFEKSGLLTDKYKYDDNSENSAAALDILITNKYIEKSKVNDVYVLTVIGRKVIDTGGHFKYLQYLKDKEVEEVERQKLSDEKLKYDVKNSKRIFKTYWLTFWVAIIGLSISIFLAILKMLEWQKI